MTATELKKRAIALAEKTKIDSVTPEEVGQLSNDIVEYIENVELNGSTLGIRKTYTSVSAMEADSTAPTDDKGVLLRRGMLVNIYNQADPSSADNGKVFSFQNPGWEFRMYVNAGIATQDEFKIVKEGANYQVIPYSNNITDTRLKVLTENRKPGYVITYNPGTGWIEEQYIGTSITDDEWGKNDNWKQTVTNDNIENIALNAQARAEEAAEQAAYAKEQADRLSSIDLSLNRVVVELPNIQDMTEDDMNKIYLMVSAKQGESNKYDEYVCVDGEWELLGQYEAAIDLTAYVGKDELSTEIATLPTLDEISKFVCIDKNGEAAGVMDKEQVASVLAGLIGTVTGEKDGLMSKSGFIERGDISDANTRFSGFLRTTGMPNTPYPSEHGILVSISTSSVCLQFFLRGWPVELYWRSLWDNWNSWNRIG